MSNTLVRGLRNAKTGPYDWKDLVTNAILSKWPTLERTGKTKAAEIALGLADAPYYFYAMKTHEKYDFVIFLHEQTQSPGETNEPNHDGGATPFDSGGFWFGHVHTYNTLDAEEKREAFWKNNIHLSRWELTFKNYVDANYESINDYIRGKAPKFGTPLIINDSPNGSRAWTWEIRYPCLLTGAHLRLERVYMRRDDRNEYIKWLWSDSMLDDNEAEFVHRWVAQGLVEIDEAKSPALEVDDTLLEMTTI